MRRRVYLDFRRVSVPNCQKLYLAVCLYSSATLIDSSRRLFPDEMLCAYTCRFTCQALIWHRRTIWFFCCHFFFSFHFCLLLLLLTFALLSYHYVLNLSLFARQDTFLPFFPVYPRNRYSNDDFHHGCRLHFASDPCHFQFHVYLRQIDCK